MNYLKITNTGLVVPEDLKLLGSSTKRGDDTKIGMFGSGWKYALAWLIRNDIDIKIYSGLDEITIGYNVVLHRSTPVRVLTINEQETSITAEAGPQWTGWMILREIISNAIDEEDFTISTIFSDKMIDQKENTTSVYIPLNNELNKVMEAYDKYFAFDRVPTFSNNTGKIYLNSEVASTSVYRKGIRCINETVLETSLDFDFNDIEINESRIAEHFDIHIKAKKILAECDTISIWEALLKNEINGFYPDRVSTVMLKVFKVLINDKEYKFVPAFLEKLGGNSAVQNRVIIPNAWYHKLVDEKLISGEFDKLMGDYNFLETDLLDLSKVHYYLSGFGLKIKMLSGKLETYHSVVYDYKREAILVNEEATHSEEMLAALIIRLLPPETLISVLK